MTLHLAVVGATGQVMRQILAERDFPVAPMSSQPTTKFRC
jgi:hypothetical protein